MKKILYLALIPTLLYSLDVSSRPSRNFTRTYDDEPNLPLLRADRLRQDISLVTPRSVDGDTADVTWSRNGITSRVGTEYEKISNSSSIQWEETNSGTSVTASQSDNSACRTVENRRDRPQ